MALMKEFFEGVAGLIMMTAVVLIVLGAIYWLWLAVQMGNAWMFAIGVIPIFFIVTGPVGVWSYVFGSLPQWVTDALAALNQLWPGH